MITETKRLTVGVRANGLSTDVTKIDLEENQVELHKKGRDPKKFKLDFVLDSSSTQCDIYDKVIKDPVNSLFEGNKVNVFAFGESKAGRTWTIEGENETEEENGLIYRACQNIFDIIDKSPQKKYTINISLINIKRGEIIDLLDFDSNKKIKFRHGKAEDLTILQIKTLEEALIILEKVTESKSKSNETHRVYSISVKTAEFDVSQGKILSTSGKLNLIDLGGSQRVKKTEMSKERCSDVVQLAASLGALGMVLSALKSKGKKHIPYRNSTLTRYLEQDLKTPQSKNIMFLNILPGNYEETIATLRMGDHLINSNPSFAPKSEENESLTDMSKTQLCEEIAKLRKQLDISNNLIKKQEESYQAAINQSIKILKNQLKPR